MGCHVRSFPAPSPAVRLLHVVWGAGSDTGSAESAQLELVLALAMSSCARDVLAVREETAGHPDRCIG